MLRREVEKEERVLEDVEKAARSAMRSAGLEEMLPRREMRRPAWSELRSRVSWNWGIRDSTCAAMSGGVVEVMVVGVDLGAVNVGWEDCVVVR